MKLFTTVIFMFFIFVGFSSAQTIKTDEARKLKQIETFIVENEKLLKEANDEVKKLSVEYTSESNEIKEFKVRISLLEENLVKLYAERKQLLTKQMVRNLPNNQIELLKILIQQNERIIDLLEKMQKQ